MITDIAEIDIILRVFFPQTGDVQRQKCSRALMAVWIVSDDIVDTVMHTVNIVHEHYPGADDSCVWNATKYLMRIAQRYFSENSAPEMAFGLMLSAVHSGAQDATKEPVQVVEIPLAVLAAIHHELAAAGNIMRAAHKHFNRADAADIRRHRRICDQLHRLLGSIIPPMWACHQEDNGARS